jgi:hypothetical protein
MVVRARAIVVCSRYVVFMLAVTVSTYCDAGRGAGSRAKMAASSITSSPVSP